MDIDIQPGTYVAAVSGGVDSMVLLDLLAHKPKLKLIIAHYDHGMRENSKQDRLFVHQAAHKQKLPFVYQEGNLGATASEAKARTARYEFLHQARAAANAKAIITAHHQDDVIETAIINLLRGTGRKGLTSLKNQNDVFRPLLNWPKHVLISYARGRGLKWREDLTNQDTKYLRNHVRHNIMPKLSTAKRRQLLQHLENLARLNNEIDTALINHLHIQPEANKLDRHYFVMLPHKQAVELLAMWLRTKGVLSFDKKLLEKLVTGAKTLRTGKKMDVDKQHIINIGKKHLTLTARTGS